MSQANIVFQALHPLDATAIGVMQHGKLKINMFSVVWSDHHETLIHRTFDEFKKLNRKLRWKFPNEAFKKEKKIIPVLRDVPLCKKKYYIKCIIERLLLLEQFSQALLKIDGKISQCELVIHFFTPRNEDLDPSFPDDSIVMLLKDLKPNRPEYPGLLPTSPPMEPDVYEIYVCIEDYETIDVRNRPFKVKCNEQLDVLVKETSGWWLVKNKNKCLAWFPAPFLKDLKDTDDSDSGTGSDDDGAQFYVSNTYKATSADEISVNIGDLVDVIEKSNTGWWLVRYNSKIGYMPSLYLQPCHSYETLETQTMSDQDKYNCNEKLLRLNDDIRLKTLPTDMRSHKKPCVTSDVDKKTDMVLQRKRSRVLTKYPRNPYSQLAEELKSFQCPSTEKPKPIERQKGLSTSSSTESDEMPIKPKKNKPRPLPRQMASDLGDMVQGSENSDYDTILPMLNPPAIEQMYVRVKKHALQRTKYDSGKYK
ncbi:NADPH oxidase organizer 1-like [Discoglossus pictus]